MLSMLEGYMEREFESLRKAYNTSAKIKQVDLTFNNKKFFQNFKKNLNTDRRGEVVFLVERKNGKKIVIKSGKYPKGVYRIPSGGIGFEEKAIDALSREMKEELGIDFKIQSFLGLVEYKINYKNEALKFYSYLFLLKEVSGVLIEDATEDEITEYLEVDDKRLVQIGEKMGEIRGGWHDWCQFRSQVIYFYKDYLKELYQCQKERESY